MGYLIKIEPEAFEDIKSASDWYENQLSGLGDIYKNNVKKIVNSLKRNPQRFAQKYSDVRCVLVDKFPFMVHYRIQENNKMVMIHAVIHTSRNPEIWKEI